MTNEEAIKRLKSDIYEYADFTENPNENEFWTAFDMAIKALEVADLDGYSSRLWKAAYERGKAEVEQRWIPVSEKYEYHIDHTDCIWYGSDGGCPVTCSQYHDGWNDAMDYIFKNGDGYRPYRRNEHG